MKYNMLTDKLQFIQLSSKILQIHEKEEQEMNEKNDNASYLSEEPLISVDQVFKAILVILRLNIQVSWRYFILHVSFVPLKSLLVDVFFPPCFSFVKVIEEIVEMMENSPDPGETEEEDEEENCSSRTNPSLLDEIRQLSQASNNNCSHEGKTRTCVAASSQPP